MSITPIDMQNSIVRTPDAKRQFNNQNDANQGMGVNNPEIIDEEIREEQRTVQQTNESEKERNIDKKEEDNKKNISLRKKRKKKKNEEDTKSAKEAKDQNRGNFVDIKIY